MRKKNTGTFALPIIVGIFALLVMSPMYCSPLSDDAPEGDHRYKIGILEERFRSPTDQNESRDIFCWFSSCFLRPSDIDLSSLIARGAERDYSFAGELPAPLQKRKSSALDIFSLSDKKFRPLYLRNITLLF
jgi:hypothetical protein